MEINREKLNKLINDYLYQLGFEGEPEEIEIDSEDNVTSIKLKDPALAELIGNNGRTLYALQHMLNLAYNKDEETRVRLLLDINNYRKGREEYLKSCADHAMTEVEGNNVSVALPPMRPAERRFIHLYIEEKGDFTTESEGEEPNRYIIINPKGK